MKSNIISAQAKFPLSIQEIENDAESAPKAKLIRQKVKKSSNLKQMLVKLNSLSSIKLNELILEHPAQINSQPNLPLLSTPEKSPAYDPFESIQTPFKKKSKNLEPLPLTLESPPKKVRSNLDNFSQLIINSNFRKQISPSNQLKDLKLEGSKASNQLMTSKEAILVENTPKKQSFMTPQVQKSLDSICLKSLKKFKRRLEFHEEKKDLLSQDKNIFNSINLKNNV